MIVWGGAAGGANYFNTGRRYCAQSASATPTPTTTASATPTATPTPCTGRCTPTPPPYASTAPNDVKIIAASSLRFRRRTRQWIMRRIAQTFAQARFGFSIQRAMSSASFRSTTRLESFDSSDSRLRCGRQRDPDARTQGRFQGVVSHFFIVPGDRCMITSCG